MHVIIIGAGVIGISSAWYLRAAGCRVTVIDSHPEVAMETSFANAGQLSAGYAAPWAAPGVPLKAARWLLQEHGPLRIRPDGSRFQLAWLARLTANCTEEAYLRNRRALLPLAEYSLAELEALQQQTGIAYEGRRLGTLQVFRKPRQLDAAERDARLLGELGIAHHLVDAGNIATIEPALARARVPLLGALHLPGDGTGDCRLFTQRLAALAVQQGITLRLATTLTGIHEQSSHIEGVQLDTHERLDCDALVMAAGCASRPLLQSLGFDLPVYPVKGYSLTMPLRDTVAVPRSTVMDETYKIALTRLDTRLRVGGMAEVAGWDRQLDSQRLATLHKVVDELFPDAAERGQASAWTGLRPMTPNGVPLIGPTQLDGLWLNTGHGTLGWTLACGSGKLLADLLSGKPPALSAAPYRL
ncbi:D-amino acid dehydrogenase [Chitinilyticum piscinae]|uniref:D-amino acid dehydrogenase n=1 Tax=Chitinilyticum piscinae TaxID=2866724 RepID=A0A8J7FFE8_9NEIS|nr:D-amino acid dehydrogenase [Chitinilyticum piscinae]MBE9607990.1 D-amino acid dehydrogenase [Chitinilyticum piscinae]